MTRKLLTRGMLAAVTLAALGTTGTAGVQAASLADPNASVASDGRIVPVVEQSRRFVASSLGQAGALGRLDRLAESSAGSESAAQLQALMRLQAVKAPQGNPESIIGADSRVRVTPTTGFPARATVLITFSAGRCTGWLIGPNTVATAGHCVHPGGGGSFYPVSSYRIYSGRNGTSSPYGSCTARKLFSVTGWTAQGKDDFDYGAIKLNCNIGNTTGWYGYFWQSGSLNGLPTIINGYPGDKPLTQWKSTDQVRVTQTRRVFYKNDTVGGMSGAPVYYNRSGCGTCSMAVHAYGTYGSPPFSNNNHGTRITQAVFNNLTAWRNAP
jgi:glutamyl endopeptidase